MKKELTPIIAAYWGAECSYYSLTLNAKVTGKNNAIFMQTLQEWRIIQDPKLHLRPLWSITEDELRELGEAIGMRKPKSSIGIQTKLLLDEMGNGFIIVAVDDIEIESNGIKSPVSLINHLRAKGFCVDQCLVDAGLVEWKEVAK